MAEGNISGEPAEGEPAQVAGGTEVAVGIFAAITMMQCIVNTFFI